jgi:hypothetical protein
VPWPDLRLSRSDFGFRISGGILEKRMLSAGWCPYWTAIYCKSHSAPLIYYLGGISTTGHEKCENTKCIAHKAAMESGKYITCHEIPDCLCKRMIGPEIEEIKSIIEKGGVSLVKLTKPSQKTPIGKSKAKIDISVGEASFGRPFIAISHVWSGGLGNPMENSLPECQIEML